jgi:hypothetical protein
MPVFPQGRLAEMNNKSFSVCQIPQFRRLPCAGCFIFS